MVTLTALALEYLSPTGVRLRHGDRGQEAESTESSGAGHRSKATTSPKILVVEDDGPLARFLCRTLRQATHEVEVAGDSRTALELLDPSINLVLLDRHLPDGDGLDVLRILRQTYPNLPVLMLTGSAEIEDTVKALHSGADDYLSKPFSYVELLARVGALLRRRSGSVAPIARVADLTLFRTEHRVERAGLKIDLTPREFHLLEFLMRTPGVPVSRATLMAEVWDVADSTSNVVDVYMKYLRDKVDMAHDVRLIRTVRGIGFMVGED